METILVVDDEFQIRSLLKTVLEKENFQVIEAESGESAIDLTKVNNLDLVLLDINMTGINGLTTFSKIKEVNSDLPILFLTGNRAPNDIIKALNLGASDYITKPFVLGEVVARVRGHLRVYRQKKELAENQHKFKTLSEIDDLTGLYNMRTTFERISQEIDRSLKHKRMISIIMIDADHFKRVNDNHEHLFGSFVLSKLGKIIKSNLRKTDFAARYGGDEFLICLTDTKIDGVSTFCERLRKEVEKTTFQQGKDSINITLSIGASIFFGGEQKEVNAKDLISLADKELYRAKDAGRNCFFVNSEYS